MTEPTGTSRRTFLKAAAAGGALATQLGAVPTVHAAGAETLRVGLVGCGGRGRGAVDNICEASQDVKIVAFGDLFRDQLDKAHEELKGKLGDRLDLGDRKFTGFDAYQKVLDAGVDLVILATPPGFRPMMLEAAVKANKNIFTEKPVATDGPGIRRVLAAAEEAKSKNLAVVAGTQRRHQAGYIESMKRIHDGAIGTITSARAYWNQGGLWSKNHEPGWSDMEWQVRNWLYFTWLSGDHICEQHVHNLDVVNWALRAHPLKAVGMGGRQARTEPVYGNIYDHFAIEYTYPNDVSVLSMCRQIEGCANNVSEAVVGTEGSWQSGGYTFRGSKAGPRIRGRETNPYVQEHIDLIKSIRDGKPLNELRQVAESTLTAIMGRMSAYTGQEVSWEDALNSKENLFPDKLAFGPIPVPPVAVPGRTKLY
ncbi:MAG TPA: Gfo/Idh/MocA family oxidoreductase [Isosphaeraceae bacterium]|jgi:predicted dehydrogenase|nr:Gfo/Idh/MocA family oxidoreductase [Isosphaeraceae bacterium]